MNILDCQAKVCETFAVFELLQTDAQSLARRGRIHTFRGIIETPHFMPVGTQASVKALDKRELIECGSQIILANAYHLALRPGMKIIEKAGGLHRFMNWDLPILTDSGGFQVFSLAKLVKQKTEGVAFRSHLDGASFFLGPKESMAIQRILASDIAMSFDSCPAFDESIEAIQAAVERTIAWAAICREQPRAPHQQIFGIVQGGKYADLREYCAKQLIAMDFDGYAIGGVSVGESQAEMMIAIEQTEVHLPTNKARYAMGLGTPSQLIELVARGVDLFDCVLPTRLARNGTAFTKKGTLNLKAAREKEICKPIEADCQCYTCRHFTRAYLRHLFNAGEILGLKLLSLHNIHSYLELMRQIREAIDGGYFASLREQYRTNYIPSRRVLAQ